MAALLCSGMHLAGFAGDDISRCVPFCGRHAEDVRHLGRYGPEGQYVARRRFRQWHVHGWFACYVAPRGVFPCLSAFRRRQWWQYMAGFACDGAQHVSLQALVVGSGTASRVLAWTRMLTCPLLGSTDARYRRAENCGAPQLPFVDQVETSLFGNADRYALCICARSRSWQSRLRRRRRSWRQICRLGAAVAGGGREAPRVADTRCPQLAR